ncbi:MAG: hypothetical protein ACTSUF_06995 [Candidatus Heimdallarchaeaceae archaeon]
MKRKEKRYFHLENLFNLKRLDEKAENEIFYFSLFDTEHFLQSGFLLSAQEIRKKISKILKKVGKNWIKGNIVNKIIDSQFFTGKITNLLLSYKLSQSLRKTVQPTLLLDKIEIDIYLGFKGLFLEIKRMYSSGNLYQYIRETIEKYKKVNKDIKNILIIFIFITKSKEESENFIRAVDGYRSLFSVLQEKNIIPKNFHFYITTFSPEHKLKQLVNDILERINSI